MRTVLHADMDAFFASVEQRDDPRLRGRPVLVGGPSKRSVVCAASYEARPSGARSAMPMAEALRRCPDAVVVPARHARYAEVSADVFAVFRRFTPLVEGLSLDEAFLDVTASQSLFGDGVAIAHRIKDAIRSELELCVSVGVASSKFVAKIASDLEKPNGLVAVTHGDEARFLAPLAIERMWGVGPKSATRLHRAGLATIGDLARAGAPRLEALLGSAGVLIAELARGVDPREVVPDRAAVSIGAEETFEEDLTQRSDLEARLLGQAARLAGRMSRAERCGRVIVVKVRYADFTLVTRRFKLAQPISDTDSIYERARELLDRFDLANRRVRLIGIAMTELIEGAPPRLLFEDPKTDKRRRLQELVDQVEGRFGHASVTRATLLQPSKEGSRDR
jgi:DNA polymerase-4